MDGDLDSGRVRPGIGENMRKLAKRPSPAMIVACLALIVALGGTAVSAGLVTKKKVKKIAKAQVAKRFPVQTSGIADNAVTRPKVANDAIDSSKVAPESLTAADLAPGVLKIVAFGRVNNGAGAPTLQNAVGLTSVVGGTDGNGRTRINVDPAVLPGGTMALCTVVATAADDVEANDDNSLAFDSVVVAAGQTAPATHIQAQTRGSAEVLNDFDYFVMVACPNA